MSDIRALLVGPRGHGGEDVYLQSLHRDAPSGVSYVLAGDFHTGAPGAPCAVTAEILLNRLVHPLAIPDMGFRALRLRAPFDLVHVHAHPVRLSRLGGTPLVMSEGSSAALYLSDYLGWDEKRLARGLARSRRIYRALGIRDRLLTLERATRAYVFSKWARDLNVRWGADPQKLDVVYPGFPIPELPRREPREEFRFLFVGRDFERKGGFEVVEAFERVLEQFPNARLTMAGDDPAARNPDREVHSWVDDARRDRAISTLRRLQAQGVVETRPWLDRRVLYGEIYGQADVFVMPTHAEGFGFTNVEAMSFALPVITSTAGPSAEIVPAGRAGLLVPAGDVESLTSAMSELLRDETRARRMGDAGRAEFLRRFTTDTFRAELGKLYQRALEAG